MYIINGIVYAGELGQPVKVESVCPLDGWRLRLRFSTGEVKMFDFADLLDFPCFRPLQDESVFRSVSLDHGVPVWLDGEIDIAPERLWMVSRKKRQPAMNCLAVKHPTCRPERQPIINFRAYNGAYCGEHRKERVAHCLQYRTIRLLSDLHLFGFSSR